MRISSLHPFSLPFSSRSHAAGQPERGGDGGEDGDHHVDDGAGEPLAVGPVALGLVLINFVV